MHAAQTAWLADCQNQADFTGGWPGAKFHLYNWALSLHCLARHYPQRTLVADSAAPICWWAAWACPIPGWISRWTASPTPSPLVWVLKKTLAYARQTGPFVHVDSDAYLFDPLPPALAEAPLLAQNLEYDHPYYVQAGQWIGRQCGSVPTWVREQPDGRFWAVNAGLIGGGNFPFFQTFHQSLLQFLAANDALLHQVPDWDHFNTFVEQAAIVGFARAKGHDFAGLLPHAIGHPYTYELDQFWRLPGRCGYLHAMNYKQNPAFCEQLAQRLRLEAPALHERANQVARELAATHHPVPGLPTGPSADGLAQITATLLPQLPPTEGAVLGDLLAYERAWLAACSQGQATLAQPGGWANIERAANDFWGRAGDLATAQVAPGPLLALIESQWNWAGANEFARQRQAHQFADHLATAPSYFVVVPLPIELGIWREYRLEPLEILLFGYLEAGPASTAALVEALLTDLHENGQAPQTSDVAQWVEDRLRFFSYFGLLSF